MLTLVIHAIIIIIIVIIIMVSFWMAAASIGYIENASLICATYEGSIKQFDLIQMNLILISIDTTKIQSEGY